MAKSILMSLLSTEILEQISLRAFTLMPNHLHLIAGAREPVSKEERPLIESLMYWRATLRPEVLELKNWPHVRPQHFRRKRLWQTGMFDHVVRNDFDLHENLDYIAMNPVRAGYVTAPQFYPYTGML